MIRTTLLAALVATLLVPAVAHALGLGNIEVQSGLNEPLRARIPVRGADPGELQELSASLGDDEQFRRAGLERMFVLTQLRFDVVETTADTGYIEVTTRGPVAEPFLNFLVDVAWSRGRVLREYTVLLDPPVYGAAITSATQARVQTVDDVPRAASPEPAPPPAPAPAVTRTPSPAPSAAPRYTGDTYGPVREGETLWSIADRVRPAGTSIQSMMLALLEANPDAFIIENINALRTGAVLRIPPASELLDDKAAALAEVASQHALWEEYRQSLTGAVTAQPGGTQPGGAAGDGGAPAQGTSESPAAASGADQSKLELVGAGGAGAAGDGEALARLRDELTVAQEEAEAARQQNSDLRSRLDEVEALVDDLKRLVELKEDQLADLQNQLARADVAPAEPAESPAPGESPTEMEAPAQTELPAQTEPPAQAELPAQAEPPAQAELPAQAEPLAQAEPSPAEPEPKPAPPPPPPPPPAPTSFLDEVNAMLPVPLWSLLGGLGALLVGLGGLSWARRRKNAAEEEAVDTGEEVTSGSMIDQYARTELPAEDDDEVVTQRPVTDTGTIVDDDEDLTQVAAPAAPAPAPPLAPEDDEEDPLAEVNVYLAYERFDQAEQLVRDAVERYPDRTEYRLKLLEVFYAAKSVASFEAAAAELQAVVGDDDPMMQQAREWWADLDTGRPLLSGESGGLDTARTPPGASDDDGDDVFDVTAGEADASGDETGVDFDLGFEETAQGAAASGLDFDLGDDDSDAERGGGLDFDLGDFGEQADEPKSATGDADETSGTGLDFDLGADDDEGARPPSGTGVDFDLGDFGDETPGDATQVEDAGTASGGGSRPERVDEGADEDVDFDLTGLDDTKAGGADDGAAGDESGLDFDLSDTMTLDGDQMARARADDRKPETPSGGAGEDSGLDFDLSETSVLGDDDASGEADAAGEDAELDFDLGEIGGDEKVTAGDREGAGSELDFDLGDTVDTTRTQSARPAAADDEEIGLDFDLGDTGEAPRPDAGAAGEESLDFDLGDTTGTSAEGDDGEAPSLDFTLDDGTGDETPSLEDPFGEGAGDEPLSLDMELDAGDDDEQRAAGGSGLDMDLTLDAGSEDDGPGTVQLTPDQADGVRPTGDDESDESMGVDTEFRGIFGLGDDGGGGSSSVDFDLGTDLEEPGDGAGGNELESTQFMLRDVPDGEEADSGDDDEDHTLVLGRGASGELDDMQTKLDLAQAYMDMGDVEGARNLLGEVMAEGSDEQQGQAREMLGKLS